MVGNSCAKNWRAILAVAKQWFRFFVVSPVLLAAAEVTIHGRWPPRPRNNVLDLLVVHRVSPEATAIIAQAQNL